MKAIAAVILVVLLLATAGFVRDARIAGDFPSIRAKSSEVDVRRIMGEPKQVQRPCQAYNTSVQPGCDHVFLYRSIFYPLRSRYWLVFFDRNNQVTATSSQLEP